MVSGSNEVKCTFILQFIQKRKLRLHPEIS